MTTLKEMIKEARHPYSELVDEICDHGRLIEAAADPESYYKCRRKKTSSFDRSKFWGMWQ